MSTGGHVQASSIVQVWGVLSWQGVAYWAAVEAKRLRQTQAAARCCKRDPCTGISLQFNQQALWLSQNTDVGPCKGF